MFKIGNFKEYVTYSHMLLVLKKRKTSFSCEAVVKRWFWPGQPFVSPAVWITSTICPFVCTLGFGASLGWGSVWRKTCYFVTLWPDCFKSVCIFYFRVVVLNLGFLFSLSCIFLPILKE